MKKIKTNPNMQQNLSHKLLPTWIMSAGVILNKFAHFSVMADFSYLLEKHFIYFFFSYLFFFSCSYLCIPYFFVRLALFHSNRTNFCGKQIV